MTISEQVKTVLAALEIADENGLYRPECYSIEEIEETQEKQGMIANAISLIRDSLIHRVAALEGGAVDAREAFERWMLAKFKGTRDGGRGMLKRDTGDNREGYFRVDTHMKWCIWRDAWNARTTHPEPQTAAEVEHVANRIDAMLRNWRQVGRQEPIPREIAKCALAAMQKGKPA